MLYFNYLFNVFRQYIVKTVSYGWRELNHLPDSCYPHGEWEEGELEVEDSTPLKTPVPIKLDRD